MKTEVTLNNQYLTKNNSFCQYNRRMLGIRKNSKQKYHKQIVSLDQNSLYQIQMQNFRILKRIISPKRDKVIMHSTQHLKKKPSNSCHDFKTKKFHSIKCTLRKQQQKQMKKYNRHANSVENYYIQKQNERMAQRIINSKSTLEKRQKFKHNSRKLINKGVKQFLNTTLLLNTFEKSQTPIAPREFNKVYGFGPTIIEIFEISLQTIPKLKDDHLISLQLLPKNSGNHKLSRNQAYCTPGIQYKILKKLQIKFAIRMKTVGEFVPLKIWKFQGIQCIQIGVFDIPFSQYIKEKQKRKSEQYQNIQKHYVLKQNFYGKLRKDKIYQSQTGINIIYAVYNKKYKYTG